MRNIRWRQSFSTVLLLFCAMVLVAGCSKSKNVAKDKKIAAAERFLVWNNLAEPEYLDPGMMTGNKENSIRLSLFEGLLTYDPKDSHPLPGVAESWEVSKDRLTYTFHLRKNATWSDGNPVTAHDFVYAWTRVLDPKTAAPYAYIMYYLKNAEAFNTGKIKDATQVGVKAADDFTFVVTLENPTPFFPSLVAHMTFSPVPQWIVEQYGAKWTLPEHIVSNGPFRLKTWTPHKELVVEKSPTYWDAGVVKLAGVRFLPIEEKETGLKMYEAGEVDVAWEVPSMKAVSLIGRPDFIRAPYFSQTFYLLNTKRPPLDDVRVRLALNLAVDRKTLCDKYLHKIHYPGTGIVPVGIQGYETPPGLEFDPKRARELLAEAGFTDPKKFPKIDILYNTDDHNKLVAQVVQSMWKTNLGIEVGLWNEEWKSYLKSQHMGQFDVSRRGWIGDVLDPENFLNLLTTSSTLNVTGWGNADYDTLIANALSEPDVAKRYSMYQQAEAILVAEAPLVPLFTRAKTMLVKQDVRGLYPTPQDVHPFKWIYFTDQSQAAGGAH